MTRPKSYIPATRPQWATGEHAVYCGEELLGYFRRFDSAHAWVRYLRRADETSRFTISHKGAVVYVSTPPQPNLLTAVLGGAK